MSLVWYHKWCHWHVSCEFHAEILTIICTYCLRRRARRENIWLKFMAHGVNKYSIILPFLCLVWLGSCKMVLVNNTQWMINCACFKWIGDMCGPDSFFWTRLALHMSTREYVFLFYRTAPVGPYGGMIIIIGTDCDIETMKTESVLFPLRTVSKWLVVVTLLLTTYRKVQRRCSKNDVFFRVYSQLMIRS